MKCQEEVKRLLHYDKDTGIFVWTEFAGQKVRGKVAGTTTWNGYVRINHYGKSYAAHRLAWLYMTGDIGDFVIDHIDGNPSNNKFENLRKSSMSQNQFNSKKSKANSSGIKGVYLHKPSGKWQASIRVNGELIYLGLHDDKFTAQKVRRDACIKYHGEFHNHG